MKTTSDDTSDVCVHTRKIKQMLSDVIDHTREDIDKVHDPKAQVLFETTAEVLIGLRTAYEHFESGAEKAMR